MWKSIAGWVSQRVRSERNKLGKSAELAWDKMLPAEKVEAVLREEGARSRDYLYSPLVTLWTFLSQVLSPDHSCREAVARLRAFLTQDGQTPCHPDTSPPGDIPKHFSADTCPRRRPNRFRGT